MQFYLGFLTNTFPGTIISEFGMVRLLAMMTSSSQNSLKSFCSRCPNKYWYHSTPRIFFLWCLCWDHMRGWPACGSLWQLQPPFLSTRRRLPRRGVYHPMPHTALWPRPCWEQTPGQSSRTANDRGGTSPGGYPTYLAGELACSAAAGKGRCLKSARYDSGRQGVWEVRTRSQTHRRLSSG